MKALPIIEAKWGKNTLIKRPVSNNQIFLLMQTALIMLAYTASEEQHSGRTQNGILEAV